MANPGLDEAERSDLVRRLGAARRSVRDAKQGADRDAEAAAHMAVDEVKRALGERGPVWWADKSPDLNRHMAKNMPTGMRKSRDRAPEDIDAESRHLRSGRNAAGFR